MKLNFLITSHILNNTEVYHLNNEVIVAGSKITKQLHSTFCFSEDILQFPWAKVSFRQGFLKNYIVGAKIRLKQPGKQNRILATYPLTHTW